MSAYRIQLPMPTLDIIVSSDHCCTQIRMQASRHLMLSRYLCCTGWDGAVHQQYQGGQRWHWKSGWWQLQAGTAVQIDGKCACGRGLTPCMTVPVPGSWRASTRLVINGSHIHAIPLQDRVFMVLRTASLKSKTAVVRGGGEGTRHWRRLSTTM